MLDEPEKIESLARFLCELDDYDPDSLRPGNMAFHSSFDAQGYSNGEYDKRFDTDKKYTPDGHDGKNVCMFRWRDYVFNAVQIIEFLRAAGDN